MKKIMYKNKLVGDSEERVQLSAMLLKLGFDESMKGTEYIRQAVFMYEPCLPLTKCIYPAIARANRTNAACVERCMRYAIDKAFCSCRNFKLKYRIYGSLAEGGEVPTIGQTIAHLWRAMIEGYTA